jgi:hypothetical protein
MDMLSFIPLHLGAIDRNHLITDWIKSLLGTDAEFLTPDQWFSRGHSHHGGYYDTSGFWRVKKRPGKFVWPPPPAAAEVAVEEVRQALIKRRDCTHVFLCPRLLTPQWRQQLNKTCDLVLFMNAGSEIWQNEMYEPLTICVVFPFLRLDCGKSEEHQRCSTCVGRCHLCSKTRTWFQGYKGSFARTLQSDVEIMHHVRRCGVEGVILHIRPYYSTSNKEKASIVRKGMNKTKNGQ